jgi:hypothetical protein
MALVWPDLGRRYSVVWSIHAARATSAAAVRAFGPEMTVEQGGAATVEGENLIDLRGLSCDTVRVRNLILHEFSEAIADRRVCGQNAPKSGASTRSQSLGG